MPIITDLTSYTTPIDTDVFPIVDVTTNTTKKITRAGLASSINYGYSVIVAPSSSNKYADYYTDGTGDDIQIEAAITAVNAAGGGIVFIRAGTYSCNDTISTPVTGTSNVIIMGEGVATDIRFVTNGKYFDIQDATNFKLLNFKISDTTKTSGSGNEYCIRLVGCSLFEVAGLYIDAYSFGMFVITEVSGTVCEKGWIHHNYMQGTRRQDVLGGGKLTDDAVAMRELLVESNHVRKNGASAAGNNYNAIDFVGFSDSKWSDNIVEGNLNLGFERDPNKRNIISGNIVKPAFGNSTVRTTLLLEDNTNTTAVSGQTIIANNFVDGCIWIHGKSDQKITKVLISNNYTLNSTARTDAQVLNITQNGILVEETTNCLVTGNYCEGGGVTPAGIEMQDSSNNHVIGNYVFNHVTGLADTGTVSGNNWSNNFTNTVTTPTSFDGGSTSNNNVDV